MRVTLTKAEYKMCDHVATARVRNNRKQGRPNMQVDLTKTNYMITLQGVCGEQAYCKRYNLYWDVSTEVGDQDDPDCQFTIPAKADCRDRDGNTVDVKTAAWRKDGKHNLLVEARKQSHGIKRYALVIGPLDGTDDRGFDVIGVVCRDKVFRQANEFNNEKGNAFRVMKEQVNGS